MSDAEQKLYDSIVHGLRSRGWSKQEAEDEAIGRILAWRDHSPVDNTPHPA